MKRTLLILLGSALLFLGSAGVVFATFEQAYKDYVFQFDLYRQANTDFQVAKNEFQKFNTLTSETTALEATKKMMTQRDVLLKAYLYALNEKLSVGTGLSSQDRQLYQTLIRNEVTFLDTHADLVPSIGSLEDAEDVSDQLESHYIILQTSIRQALNALAIGEVSHEAASYGAILAAAQAMVDSHAAEYSQGKISTFNRWILQIKNKEVLYQQKLETARKLNAILDGESVADLDQSHATIQSTIADAKQYLLEGIGFEKELLNEMKYTD